jgi:hypothetical protein
MCCEISGHHQVMKTPERVVLVVIHQASVKDYTNC